MFRRSFFLACAAIVALGANAWSAAVTTNITLVTPYGGGSDVAQLVNVNAGVGAGESYTVAEKTINGGVGPGNTVYATGAILLSGTKFLSGQSTLKGDNLVLTYAIQGTQISPVGGATLSATFDKGVLGIYDITGNLNTGDVKTWGPLTAGSKLVYSSTLINPIVTSKGISPAGDPGFAGQGLAGQNEASFFASTSVSASGAFITQTNANLANLLNALFNSPNAFNGFQAEIQEVNSLDPSHSPPDTFTPVAGANDNAALDANFAAVAALDPTVTFKTLTPFTDNTYAPNAFGSNGDALQEIGITLYPVLIPTTTTTTTTIPEPASLLVWAGIAAGLGIYRRGRRSRVTKTSSP